jgi:hypothetical protein
MLYNFMFVFKKYDRQNHVWSFMTKYLRFLCKFTSWSGESPFLCKFTSWSGETPTGIDLSLDGDFLTGNFSDVFLSWTRIMSVLIVFSEKKGMRVLNVSPYKNNNYQTNFIIDDPLSRKHRSLTFVDNALHLLYTRVFIRKFPFIFEKLQNYVRPSAMHKSNLALIKLMIWIIKYSHIFKT